MAVYSAPTARNEPKRSFYNDEQQAITTPIQPDSRAPIKQEMLDGHIISSNDSLETQMKSLRTTAISKLNLVHAEYNNITSAANNELNNLKASVLSYYDPRDHFQPNFIYALTLTLSSAVFVNNRSFLTRFSVPLACGLASFNYLLPRTFRNVKNAVQNYEADYHPDLLEFQRSVKATSKNLTTSATVLAADLNQQLISAVHDVTSYFK